MRSIGDAYVKKEFRLFRNVKDETQLSGFYKEWELYANHILETSRAKKVQEAGIVNDGDRDLYKFGAHLDSNVEIGAT